MINFINLENHIGFGRSAMSSKMRQNDALNHEETKSISFRLPERLVTDIQTEAQLNDVSPNVLVRRILERYIGGMPMLQRQDSHPLQKV